MYKKKQQTYEVLLLLINYNKFNIYILLIIILLLKINKIN